jgi:hypothetical protein
MTYNDIFHEGRLYGCRISFLDLPFNRRGQSLGGAGHRGQGMARVKHGLVSDPLPIGPLHSFPPRRSQQGKIAAVPECSLPTTW